jgi:NitT/TauT family transport system ATP-binding protein
MIVSSQNVEMVFSQRGTSRAALTDLTFRTHPGEFLSIVGPSGCGKTTLLRLLAGLLQPTGGRIELIHEPADGRGGALLVRQENALFPWKTALENAAFGLEMQGVPRPEREARAHQMLQRFRLNGAEHAYPRELSLGMKQRVAVIRVFLSNPALLLLDEPFGALDAQTRMELQQELLTVWSESANLGAVFVTHDVDEAILLSDRILVFSDRPGTVLGEFTVHLPRPRPAELALESDFLALKGRLLAAIGFHTRTRANV